MRPIIKTAEPESLTEHRSKPHSDYDNYAEKDDLRVSLVAEQGALCCYCLRRIHADGALMKIEHWLCQEDHKDRCLDYGNLLAACLGGQGMPPRLQHCDTRKGRLPLDRNPAAAQPPIDRDIHYLTDGMIRSENAEFDRQLNEVLNLNVKRLKNNRKAVLDALKEWAERAGKLRVKDIRQEINEWEVIEDGILREYVQVATYWLRKRLRGA